MQERTRAYRRFRRDVKKHSVRRYGVAGFWYRNAVAVSDKKVLSMVATTPKNCGCWMCSNATTHHGLRACDERKLAQFDIALGLEE